MGQNYLPEDLVQENGYYLHPKYGYEICGAHAKQRPDGGLCMARAGWKTDHPGVGRCKFHGGNNQTAKSLVKRYGLHTYLQIPELANLVQQLSEDRDVYDVTEHIRIMEAIMIQLLNTADFPAAAKISMDIVKSVRILDEIQHGRRYVITIVDVAKILERVVEIIERFVLDEHARALIAPELASIQLNALPAPTSKTGIIEGTVSQAE